MKTLKKLLLTRALLVFGIWCLPGVVMGMWRIAADPDTLGVVYPLMVLWCMAGFLCVNASVGLMRRPALRALDEDCDPEPLLELCQAVIRQNPRVVSYRVLEAWALTLLGREEEALASANLVEGRWKLRRSAALVLTWCVVLPPDDPRREKTLKRMARGLLVPKKFRRAAREMLEWSETVSRLGEGAPELEPILLSRLEAAGCTRDQVAAHMALGVYYCRRGQMDKAQEHLGFVAAHGGKLAVRGDAERLLCRLPAE